MADRVNIVLYDARNRQCHWRRGPILYQHWGDWPGTTGPELETALKSAAITISKDKWCSQSVSDFLLQHVDAFEKTDQIHTDIVYLWRLMIGTKHGVFEIQCFNVIFDWRINELKHMRAIDWRQEAKEMQKQ